MLTIKRIVAHLSVRGFAQDAVICPAHAPFAGEYLDVCGSLN